MELIELLDFSSVPFVPSGKALKEATGEPRERLFSRGDSFRAEGTDRGDGGVDVIGQRGVQEGSHSSNHIRIEQNAVYGILIAKELIIWICSTGGKGVDGDRVSLEIRIER